MAKRSNLEIDNFTTLRRKWKCSILKIVSFTKLKTEKVKKIAKIEKYIFKTKACDSFSLAPMERAPQNYPKKCVNSKSPKIELDGFTKPGPNVISFFSQSCGISNRSSKNSLECFDTITFDYEKKILSHIIKFWGVQRML